MCRDLIRFLLSAAFACVCSMGQVTSLSFRPVGVKYSTTLDRIIFVSASPNQLHIYNPASPLDQTIALAEVPVSVAVSPDGTHAAVGFADAVAYVDLQAGSIVQMFSGLPIAGDQVIFGNGYIYAFPQPVVGNVGTGNIVSVNLSNGTVKSDGLNQASGGVFDSLTNAVYSAEDGIGPSLLYRYDASSGVIKLLPADSSFTGISYVCSPLQDGSVIYTGCGTVFHASPDSSKDMSYAGTISGLVSQNGWATIAPMSVSNSLQQLAAIPQPPLNTVTGVGSQPLADTFVELFNTTSLNLAGQFATTPFSAGGANYPAHGRWVFYNSASSAIYLITQADSAANLAHDFALETIDLTKSNSCGATFAASSETATAPGGYLTAQISASEHCVFTVVSNAPWIVLASGLRLRQFHTYLSCASQSGLIAALGLHQHWVTDFGRDSICSDSVVRPKSVKLQTNRGRLR